MEEERYICPRCEQEIEGPRYSSRDGMVCEECNNDIWHEEFKQEE